jgi:hypothetical protein
MGYSAMARPGPVFSGRLVSTWGVSTCGVAGFVDVLGTRRLFISAAVCAEVVTATLLGGGLGLADGFGFRGDCQVQAMGEEHVIDDAYLA